MIAGLNDDIVEEILQNPKPTSKLHWVCDCPWCGKKQHFYVKRATDLLDKYGVNKSYNYDCKRCGERGRVYKLLAKLECLHLLKGAVVDIDKKLSTDIANNLKEEFDIDIEAPTIKLPIGFNRLYSSKYLTSRGFTDFEYNKYICGRTKFISKIKNYIIVAVMEDDDVKGYLARSLLTNKEIDILNAKYEEKELLRRHRRYRNSEHNFSKLLLGYDEIDFLTDTIILVEGLFDKVRVDQILKLDLQSVLKCCCTFGSTVSIEQMIKLKSKGIDNLILIQDPDVVMKSKKTGVFLRKQFNTLVGYTGNKDLGASNAKEIRHVLSCLENPFSYSVNKLQLPQL